jgi:hypothetical protein
MAGLGFSFLMNFHTDFHSICTILHSHQQYVRVLPRPTPVSPAFVVDLEKVDPYFNDVCMPQKNIGILFNICLQFLLYVILCAQIFNLVLTQNFHPWSGS